MRIDDNENIYLQDENVVGKLNGFVFIPSDTFSSSEELENFISDCFNKKIDKLINEGDAALRLNETLSVTYNDAVVAHLTATENIFRPDFTPVLDERIQGLPLARLALHLESWLKRQLNSAQDPLDILSKTEDLSTESQEFVRVISDYMGYAPRHKIDAVVKKVSANDRVKLRKAGVRFAQYGVFVRDMLKPGAQKIKLILWALKNNLNLPEFPPSGVVTIPHNPELPDEYYDIAGYKICGEYAVRADMIEKLADAIRPLAQKSDANPKGEFEITAQHMSFVGKSKEDFDNVLKSLGYKFRIENVTITSVSLNQTPKNDVTDNQTAHSDDTTAYEQAENLDQTTIINNSETISQPEEIIENQHNDSNPQDGADDNQNVSIKETQVEKKIWFWSPQSHSKPKREFKKPFANQASGQESQPRFNSKRNDKRNKPETSHSEEPSQKKEGFQKSDRNKDKSDHFKKEKKKNFSDKFKEPTQSNNGPYVNMPGRHKIANENNPFAALASLKNKEN